MTLMYEFGVRVVDEPELRVPAARPLKGRRVRSEKPRRRKQLDRRARQQKPCCSDAERTSIQEEEE